MAFKKLPIDSTKLKYEVKTTIKEKDFWIDYRYNKRAGKWVISILDENKNPIIQGVFINQNATINKWISKEELEDIDLFTLRVEG